MLTAILHSRRREAIWCTPCGHDTAWEEEVRHDFGGGRIRSEMAQTIHDDPLVRDRSEHTPLYSPQRYLAAMRTRITLGARVCPPPNTKPTPSRERARGAIAKQMCLDSDAGRLPARPTVHRLSVTSAICDMFRLAVYAVSSRPAGKRGKPPAIAKPGQHCPDPFELACNPRL
ncbi:hypothetical protein OH76DRAFT_1034473 [Lentinus brumalis]|uniref:Uncharacterized protein n=1 Tax=Lentinus brumalis TaxID=2498619 RepID=A0A371CX41_9APHY|nr:hypothetical protein OH76DRAFT_1034473 [Polyporus brumalis]